MDKIKIFMAVTIILASSLCGCRPQTVSLTSLKGGETGTFKFPTRDVAGFKDLMTGDKVYNAESLGTLLLPPQAGPKNKVPVMVILHGSGGEWSGRGADQAKFLVQNGIGAFVVDTFVSRGLDKTDKYIRRLMKVNFPDQLTDAFAALDILHTHPFVDGNRIGVMGYSMGGASSLLAAFEEIAQKSSATNQRFALHVAFYAPCIIQPENCRGTGAPVVGLWGEKDEATPKSRCQELIKCFEAGGTSVKAIWYPDAAHGWNGQSPVKFYEDIPNFSRCRYTILSDGKVFEAFAIMESTTDKEFIENSEHCVGYGYAIGRHEGTYAKANQALLTAIKTYMPEPEK